MGSDTVGLLGLIVSVVGFGVTIWQLVRTANASVATKKAILESNKRMLLNHLLVLMPQLRSLESDLDTAIADNNLFNAIRILNAFSHAANQIAALLESQPDSDDVVLVQELRACAKSASANKAALVSGVAKPLRTVLKGVASQIGDVAAKCTGLTTKYQMKAV